MITSGPVLPLAAVVVPLLLGLIAAVPAVRPRAISLLPWAPLPALALSVLGAREETASDVLLLDVRLGLGSESALFLGASALLWALAGLYATAYLRGTAKPAVFTAFWCLTLAGNLGVFLARDAVTFYASFTAVSLPAYILIVHEATARALRAGRIYMVLALIGETSLLSGLIVACGEAQSAEIVEVRQALAVSPVRDAVLLLLVVGFGIKAGLVPLHVWLPLAHPEAPTPASAVLSGAIVKAGIFGLILFLPTGAGMGGWSLGLIAAGLFGTYAAVLVGLTQANPKAVLAYSTVSQMGLMIAAAGVALTSDEPGHVAALVALYAVHHGLAKGALFLSVGVAGHTGRRTWPILLAAVALLALSVSGLPFTGGGVTKAALKGAFHGPAKLAVAASAAGTALLLLRFAVVLRRARAEASEARAEPRLSGPFYAAGLAALVAPWLLLPSADLDAAYILSPANLWSACWPLAIAAALGLAGLRLRPSPPAVPTGDLAVAVDWLSRAHAPQVLSRRFRPPLPRLRPAGDLLERWLGQWSVAGLLLLGFALAVTSLLA